MPAQLALFPYSDPPPWRLQSSSRICCQTKWDFLCCWGTFPASDHSVIPASPCTRPRCTCGHLSSDDLSSSHMWACCRTWSQCDPIHSQAHMVCQGPGWCMFRLGTPLPPHRCHSSPSPLPPCYAVQQKQLMMRRFLCSAASPLVWWFASHCTWVGIVMPSVSASNSSLIFCRLCVPVPMYRMRGTAWMLSLSEGSFSSTSTNPLSIVLAAVMMISRYCRGISAVAVHCVIAVIAPLAFHLAFMIVMWAGACWWKRALLIADGISWSILLGSGTLSSLFTIRHLSDMLYPVVRAGLGPVGAFGLCVCGWPVSHLLAEIGVGLGWGLGSCRGSGCSVSSSLGLGFCCCCSWCFSGPPSCVAPACCEVCRPPPSCLAVSSRPSFLPSWAGAASRTLAWASSSTVMSTMPVLHGTLSLWRSSHFISLSSSHTFMTSHCASSCAGCASCILAILSMVWCSWVTSRARCLTVHSIWLLLSPGALTGTNGSLLSLLPFSLPCHCSLATMKDMHVVFPDLWSAMPLTSPASAMSISLSTGGFSIIPPIRRLPTGVAIVAGLPDVALRCLRLASFDFPRGLDVWF